MVHCFVLNPHQLYKFFYSQNYIILFLKSTAWRAIAHVRPALISFWCAGLWWICCDHHFLLNCHDGLGEIPSRMQVFRVKQERRKFKGIPSHNSWCCNASTLCHGKSLKHPCEGVLTQWTQTYFIADES